VGKGTFGENCGGERWLVRGAGAACLEHLQIFTHEFYPICILIYIPSRPTHEVSLFHYRYCSAFMYQTTKPYSTKFKITYDPFFGAIVRKRYKGAIPRVHVSGQFFLLALSVCGSISKYPVPPHIL
jgi:hypothetical protein